MTTPRDPAALADALAAAVAPGETDHDALGFVIRNLPDILAALRAPLPTPSKGPAAQ